MHPAPSIIVFTVLSGAGYGLLFWLAAARLLDLAPREPWLGTLGIGLALALVTIGLISSSLHLGQPRRAWRAITQWTSSWLSREAVMAVLTYPLALLFGLAWLTDWLPPEPALWATLATMLACLLTVYCTAKIYHVLKPVREWRQPLVPLLYLAFALFTGALLANLLLAALAAPDPLMALLAAALGALALLLKQRYWRSIDEVNHQHSPETATGLGPFGWVRQLDPPHTETNYLLQEMGFRIGRKHALKLRRLTFMAGGAAAVLAAVSGLLPAWAAIVVAAAALLLGAATTLGERWLFFAEATHTVMLYYETQAVQRHESAVFKR